MPYFSKKPPSLEKKDLEPLEQLNQNERKDSKNLIEKIRTYINSKEFGELFKNIYENPNISLETKILLEERWRTNLHHDFIRLQNRVTNLNELGQGDSVEIRKDLNTYISNLNKFVKELESELRTTEEQGDKETARSILDEFPEEEQIKPDDLCDRIWDSTETELEMNYKKMIEQLEEIDRSELKENTNFYKAYWIVLQTKFDNEYNSLLIEDENSIDGKKLNEGAIRSLEGNKQSELEDFVNKVIDNLQNEQNSKSLVSTAKEIKSLLQEK